MKCYTFRAYIFYDVRSPKQGKCVTILSVQVTKDDFKLEVYLKKIKVSGHAIIEYIG